MNLLNAKKLQNVWHQFLKARVFDSRHTLSAMEVSRCGVTTLLTFSGVVHQKFCHFAQSAAFFAVVHDDSDSTTLSGSGGIFNSVHQIRTASANVRAKNIRAIAFIMHSTSELHFWIGKIFGVSKNISGGAADGWQNHFQIRTRDQLWIHAAGFLKKNSTKFALINIQALSDAWQIPHGI